MGGTARGVAGRAAFGSACDRSGLPLVCLRIADDTLDNGDWGGVAGLMLTDFDDLRALDGLWLEHLLADVDPRFHGTSRPAATRAEVVRAMQPYIEAELERGTALKHITRHMTGLYRDVPGARTWRRCLGRQPAEPGGGADLVRRRFVRATLDDPFGARCRTGRILGGSN